MWLINAQQKIPRHRDALKTSFKIQGCNNEQFVWNIFPT